MNVSRREEETRDVSGFGRERDGWCMVGGGVDERNLTTRG